MGIAAIMRNFAGYVGCADFVNDGHGDGNVDGDKDHDDDDFHHSDACADGSWR